jgi:hypothetical protein
MLNLAHLHQPTGKFKSFIIGWLHIFELRGHFSSGKNVTAAMIG